MHAFTSACARYDVKVLKYIFITCTCLYCLYMYICKYVCVRACTCICVSFPFICTTLYWFFCCIFFTLYIFNYLWDLYFLVQNLYIPFPWYSLIFLLLLPFHILGCWFFMSLCTNKSVSFHLHILLDADYC